MDHVCGWLCQGDLARRQSLTYVASALAAGRGTSTILSWRSNTLPSVKSAIDRQCAGERDTATESLVELASLLRLAPTKRLLG